MKPERAARAGGPKPRPRSVEAAVPEDLREGFEEVVRFYLAEFRATRRRVEVEGRRHRDDKGKWYPNPLVAQRDKAASEFVRGLKEYPSMTAADATEGLYGGEVIDVREKLEQRWAENEKRKKAE